MTYLRKLAKLAVIAFVVTYAICWMTAAADHDLNADYVATHPCLERRRTLPNYRSYLGVPVWNPAATGYECAAVDDLIWIDDPQPERFQ